MSEHIIVTDEDGVRRIVIDRPAKRNSLTRAMMRALRDAFAGAEAAPGVRAVLLATTGDVFCAGADLDGLAGDPLTEEADPGHQFLLTVADARKPLVVAVQGAAVGIGATMLLHFDLIYGAPEATLRMPFVDLGLTPEAGSTFLLPALMGRARASKMLLLCDKIDAQQALAAGLFTEIADRSSLNARAADTARRLAAKPPQALAITKRMMGRDDMRRLMDDEQDVFRERMRSQEFRDAIEAARASRK